MHSRPGNIQRHHESTLTNVQSNSRSMPTFQAVLPLQVGATKKEWQFWTTVQRPHLGQHFQEGSDHYVLSFAGIMDTTFHVEQILKERLLPFIQAKFADGHCFQQSVTQSILAAWLSSTWSARELTGKWPPWESRPQSYQTDLEWAQAFPVNKGKATTKEELTAEILQFWREQITAEKCQKVLL